MYAGHEKSRRFYCRIRRLPGKSICTFYRFFTGALITFKSSSSTQPESRPARSRLFRRRLRAYSTTLVSSGVYVTTYFCFFIRHASLSLPLYMQERRPANVRLYIAACGSADGYMVDYLSDRFFAFPSALSYQGSFGSSKFVVFRGLSLWEMPLLSGFYAVMSLSA